MKYLFLILLFIASGCSSTWESSSAVSTRGSGEQRTIVAASTQRAESLNGDEVFLLIYREGGFVGSATAWPVQYNGTKIGALKNGSFIAIKTNAGIKTLTPESHLGIYSEGVEQFELNADAGRTYYLKHGPDSIYTSKVKIRQVPAAKASAEIAKYSLVKVINEYRGSVVKSEGNISSVIGRVFIERGIRTLPARPGSPLYVGDKVNVEEDSRANIIIRGGLIKITEKMSYQIPDAPKAAPPPGMASKAWIKIKKLLEGENFELKGATSTGGVRG
ncbi:DUF2846 domain-containing protein [Hoeflea sp. G2-23]|uniref:DUF2846 domain-containing protein n=1 Tax=Hoeflea algicola TaxID=2983763 RepID=A0ABT3ZG03_9HYPH|nr:DUF2846 domain-containing protein [Hoeflea algicola]MCY0149303.1 DUF2846 domain-containing protein [Hoeflea algicola]MCY0150608.1 DUF2846 domain-containing protein [Hoeflea algicola]